MEIPRNIQPRDAAFWINVFSTLISSATLVAYGLPETSETIKFWSSLFAGTLELVGIGAYTWDIIPLTIGQFRTFSLPEKPPVRELLSNRRFHTLLLVLTNVILSQRLLALQHTR